VKAMITALAGGVGAARFLTGLVKLVDEKDLSIIVNTGDDIEMFGLHVSPDIDIVTYTLAGIVDEEKGGKSEETPFTALKRLEDLTVKYGSISVIGTLLCTFSEQTC
jgi:LPPG:FO 2-phospho-L-lactate transferase